ncbi:MAG: hypothetical protein ACFCUR_09580 [Rhodomicrobiaceae bacterium]
MKKIIDPKYTAFLKTQLDSGNHIRSKKALQELCKFYRGGQKIGNPQDLYAIEQSIIGLLFAQGNDEKIRRWALNAIAQFGREKFSRDAVIYALDKYSHDPATAASAVAAFCSISKDAQDYLNQRDILSKELVVLAALQRIPVQSVDIGETTVNIDAADAAILKLALIIVGMDRAPEHLFDPKYPNSKIVSVLGGHCDKIVSQYSVWAITESSQLGLSDLGMELKNIEAMPANVRSWVFKLIGMDEDNAEANFEYLRLGSDDPQPEARLGLAEGLKDTFFDGLDPLVMDWLWSEHDDDVRAALVDHLIKQSDRSKAYNEAAVELYEHASESRERMEAVAAGSKIYGRFKQISADPLPDFFLTRDNSCIGAQVINIYKVKNIHGKAVSIGGDAANEENTNTYYSAHNLNLIQSELLRAEELVQNSSISKVLKNEASKAITAAKNEPNPGVLASVVDVLGRVKDGAKNVQGLGDALAGIIANLEKISPF